MKTLEDATIRLVFEKFHPKDEIIPFSIRGKDYLIFNAPRPLCGDPSWTGDFIHGCHYCAIDPNDEYSPAFIDQTIRLDGHLLQWVSENDLKAYGESLAKEYNLTYDQLMESFDLTDLWSSYLYNEERKLRKSNDNNK